MVWQSLEERGLMVLMISVCEGTAMLVCVKAECLSFPLDFEIVSLYFLSGSVAKELS